MISRMMPDNPISFGGARSGSDPLVTLLPLRGGWRW